MCVRGSVRATGWSSRGALRLACYPAGGSHLPGCMASRPSPPWPSPPLREQQRAAGRRPRAPGGPPGLDPLLPFSRCSLPGQGVDEKRGPTGLATPFGLVRESGRKAWGDRRAGTDWFSDQQSNRRQLKTNIVCVRLACGAEVEGRGHSHVFSPEAPLLPLSLAAFGSLLRQMRGCRK